MVDWALVRIEDVFTFFKIFTNSDRYLRYKTARDILDLEETNKNFVSRVYFTSEIVRKDH